MLNGDLIISQLAILVKSVEKLLSVSSGTVTTNLSILAVEVLSDFLERSVSSFDEEEVDNSQFEAQPAVVDDVVLPFDGVDSLWVDVVVEEESTVDEEEHDSETLGTNLEWKNFDGVTNEKTRPGQVVAGIVEIDHSDDGTSGSLVSSGLTTFRADRPCNEAGQHTTGGGKEKWATTKAVNHEGHSTGNNHIPDLKTSVDQVLVNLLVDANLVENESDVVGNERVTRPLGEETGAQTNEHSVSVTLGRPEDRDLLLVEFLLKSDGLLNLNEFVSDEVVIEVSVGVVLSKNGKGLLMTVDGDQPTWRFWDEPDKTDHDASWTSLENGRSSPCPVRLDLKSSKGSPGGNDGTEIPGSIVDGGNPGTVLHMGQFGNEQWSSSVGERDTETDQETSTNEHTKILGGGLEGDTNEHDEQTDHDGDPTPSPIRQEWREWDGDDGTD